MDPENQLDAETENAASEIISQMPDVQEHAIAAAESERAAASPALPATEGGNVDKNGVAFDPEIHTGSKLKNGCWRERKKKDGEPAKAKSIVARSGKSTDVQADPNAATQAEAAATGLLIATLILGACQSMGGDEWEPSQQERDFQVSAWQAYCLAKGMTELSPGWGVAVAFGSYAAPRFTKPKTSAKIRGVRDWCVLRFAKFKLKRELKARGIKASVTIKGGDILINGKSRAEFEPAK